MSWCLVTKPVLKEPLPEPRSGSCVAVVEDCMFMWGGHTEWLFESEVGSGPEIKTAVYPVEDTLPNTDENVIDVYDILHNTWHQRPTTGDVPDLGNGSALIPFEHYLFLFGGWNDGAFSSELYCFNTLTNAWELVALSDESMKPSPRYLIGAVLYNGEICIFGGVGAPIAIGDIQPGAAYTSYRQYSLDRGFGWNNEMFLYSISKRKWRAAEVVGQRPPPCGGVTFNMIDSHRALLLGGRQESGRVNHIYIFDFETMHWSAPIMQSSLEESWPTGRTFHTVSCLIDPAAICELQKKDPELSQKVLMLWGKGNDDKHSQDAWILDVNETKWTQVDLPLKPRMWHMAVSYHMEQCRTDVVLIGGNIRRSSPSEKHVVTGLTLLSFGVLSLKHLCLEFVRNHLGSLHQVIDTCPARLRNTVTNYISKCGSP